MPEWKASECQHVRKIPPAIAGFEDEINPNQVMQELLEAGKGKDTFSLRAS